MGRTSASPSPSPASAPPVHPPLLVLDIPSMDVALQPVIRLVLADMKRGKLPELEEIEKDDEATAGATSILKSLIQFAVYHMLLEDINKADIPFSGKPEVGCLVHKKLRVRKKLGSGAYGNVFSIDAKTAVKVFSMSDHTPGVEGQRLEFLNEVEMGKKAHALGVGPKVIDAFVCTARHKQHHGIIIMALIPGPLLRDWTKRASEPKAAAMRAKVEAAIHRLHKGGVFHNDLHSGNIIVTKNDIPVIVDFGFAKNNDKEDRPWNRSMGPNGPGKAGKGKPRHQDFHILRQIKAGGDEGWRNKWRGPGSQHGIQTIIRHVVRRAVSMGVLKVLV